VDVLRGHITREYAEELATLRAEVEEARGLVPRGNLYRLRTIADEAFGPLPVQTVDETLTTIEQGIQRQRTEIEALRTYRDDVENAKRQTVEELLDAGFTQSVVRDIMDQHARGEITYNRMVEMLREKCAEAAYPPVAGSVPTAAELLERAHDMLARAHIMLDGWQQAVDWHNDYERFKAQNSANHMTSPEVTP
jgi:hypothetical protein